MGHGQTVTVTHGRKTRDLTSLAESSSFARASQPRRPITPLSNYVGEMTASKIPLASVAKRAVSHT